MKLRITDNSFRFRIASNELAQLQRDGFLECTTTAFTSENEEQVFRFRIRHQPESEKSEVKLEPFAATFVVSSSDLESLSDQSREGVYVESEWVDSQGQLKGFTACVEKDRPRRAHRQPEE